MLQSLSFARKRPQKYRKKEWWFGHDYWHKRNMSFIALSYWYNANNQRKQKQRWWKIISLWHRYDWYHTLVIMEIRSKRPNTKKATHTWMWMAMDVNNVKRYCMLRPMVVEYELFFHGVDGSSNHVVREVDLDGISGSIFLCINYFGIDLSCCYLFMAKHFADCIDVCAIGKL